MGKKGGKEKAIEYKGPSPEEIKAQYQQQSILLKQQEAAYTSQFQSQFESLRGAYENSVNILTTQMQDREKTQSTLLGELRGQYAATQQENDRNKGLYNQLLTKQQQQEQLAAAQQYKAQVLAQEASAQEATKASKSLNTLNQRRRTTQNSRSNAGSLSAYSAASAPLTSLLR